MGEIFHIAVPTNYLVYQPQEIYNVADASWWGQWEIIVKYSGINKKYMQETVK